MPRWLFLIGTTLILWIALVLRLEHLLVWNAFTDEALYLAWSQMLVKGTVEYPFLFTGKYFLGLTLFLFQVGGPGALWLGRASVGVLTLLNCAACTALGQRLGGRPAGLLAGALYAVIPFAVFHDRQILADPLLTIPGTLLLLTLVRLAQRLDWRSVGLGALLLALAIGYKISGVLYLVAFFWMVVCLPASGLQRKRLTYLGVLTALFGLLGLGLLLISLRPWLGLGGQTLVSGQEGLTECPPLICGFDILAQWRSLSLAFLQLTDMISVYWGWGVTVLAFGGIFFLRNRTQQFIWWTGLSLLVLFFVITRPVIPRYFSPVLAPVLALASSTFFAVLRKVPSPRWRIALAAVGLIGLFYPVLTSAQLITKPAGRNLPLVDDVQYFIGQFAPPDDLRHLAVDIEARDPAPVVLVNGGSLVEMVGIYFNRDDALIQAAYPILAPQIRLRLSDGKPIYLVDQVRVNEFRTSDRANLFGVYRRNPEWFIRVRRFDKGSEADQFVREMLDLNYALP